MSEWVKGATRIVSQKEKRKRKKESEVDSAKRLWDAGTETLRGLSNPKEKFIR